MYYMKYFVFYVDRCVEEVVSLEAGTREECDAAVAAWVAERKAKRKSVTLRRVVPVGELPEDGYVVRKAWILKFLESNSCVDVMNEQFHDQYHLEFPRYGREMKCWGSCPVAQAGKDLRAMAKEGLLTSGTTGFRGNWMSGFPRWVVSYTLPGRG